MLLLMGFLLPSGLHAKQFVDFCMMEMAEHHSSESAHECCDSEDEKKSSSSHGHHDCDWGAICACSMDQSPLSNEKWIPSSSQAAIIFPKSGYDYSYFSSDEQIRNELRPGLHNHHPPLYLVYDTLLI